MKSLSQDHILARLVESKKERLWKAQRLTPDTIVRAMATKAPPAPSFRAAMESPKRVRIVAEIKKASPSKGILCSELDIDRTAAAYARGGAAAISVVTEEDHFKGSLGWVRQCAKVSGLPVLRKDFVFSPYQVYETRAGGASAILLIVAMLRSEELKALIDLSRAVRLDPVVEVHDEMELAEALNAGADIVGVNNRDLKTFRVDLQTSVRLAGQIPESAIFIAESGINGRKDIEVLLDAGADAFLVGEHLVASGDPERTLRELL